VLRELNLLEVFDSDSLLLLPLLLFVSNYPLWIYEDGLYVFAVIIKINLLYWLLGLDYLG
jgi:hypothetical protein